MRYLIIILFVLLHITSCEEQIDWELDDHIAPRLVVEGMLTNKSGLNYVRLSLPVQNPNRQPQMVSNATVLISDGTNQHILTESGNEPGLYLTDPGIQGVINKVYWLYITIGQYQFLAATYMIPVTPLKDFSYYEDHSLDGNYIINPLQSNSPAYIEYRVEWVSSPDGEEHESIFYSYTLSTLSVSQFFKPAAERLSYPADARIIRTKYSLSGDHEKYLRSLLSETEWRGGMFDVLPGNLHTNLSQGAVGYFAASSVVRDTVYFN